MSIKKGNSSWKPASLNEFTNKDPNFRYRMVRKDPNNLAKKQAEGWEPVESKETPRIDPNRIEHGKPLTSVQEGNDWVLQRIPEERAKQRDEYYSKENERRIAGLTAHIKEKTRDTGASTHGEITISSRKGTKTYEG